MSKLDELIKELCPDLPAGRQVWVEYKTLEQLTQCTIVKTITPTLKIKRNEYKESGKTAIISQEEEYISGYCDFEDKNIPNDNYVCFGDHSEHLKYIDFAFVQGADGLKIMKCDESKLKTKYLYYALCNFYRRHDNYERHFKYLLESQIPVPPLPVQEEIVRILDKFTSLTAELIAELTAELTSRRKQYEYYRDSLLTRETKVEVKKLGELFDFRNGLSKGKEFFGRGVPFITYSDVYNKNFLHKSDINALVECTDDEKSKLHVGRGDVLFTRTSETAEDVGHSSVMLDDIGDCVFNGFTIKATPKTEKLLPEYCAYCFNTYSFRKYVTANCAFTTRASLTGATIAEYEISIPSLEVQERIVNVLDNFDSICSDLKIGLPAEIEARKKQYEYYRDLLLNFDTIHVNGGAEPKR